jgi:hypothetical protein
MYSSNRTAEDSKIDDIMVIDVLGEQEMAPPQSTPIKKVKTDLSLKLVKYSLLFYFCITESCCKEKEG